MRSILLALCLMIALPTFAAPTPYSPEVDRRFKALEAQMDTQSTEGTKSKKLARFVYDTATDGGSIAPHTLGVYLPANAKITRSYLYVVTQFSDTGSGTVALHCEDANNIKTATDITGSAAGAFIEGASTGAASAFVGSIASQCEITATVAGSVQATGKLVGFVEYVVGL